ncbi:MFS transporter [Fangia hongkongensis]|uniref:MFS transporter n=3 Tax=Fangia hongkongensis TaxID=270495 RepID=UPI00036015AE|nr:MFS transporter [Fangia hongkongensis]
MRQVSSQSVPYQFFIQAYLLIFSTEFLYALINPSYVQLFFDPHSPFAIGAQAHHTQSVMYGVFMMASQIAGLCANLIWGWASDKIGRKPVASISVVSVFITASFALWAAKSELLLLFIIGYIIGHLLYGMFPVVIASVSSAAYHHKKKLLWVGLLQFFTGAAFVLGPYIGGVIMSSTGNFIAPYYILLYASIPLIAIIFYFYRPNKYYTQPKTEKIKGGSITLLKQKRIVILVILLLLDQIAWGVFFQFVQPIAKLSFGFNVSEIGLLVSFIGLSLMCSALIFLPILQKFLSHHMLYILAILAMLISTLGISALSFVGNESLSIFVYLFSFLMAFGDMVMFSLLVVSFSGAVPANRQGLISGVLYTLAKGFGWGTAALFGGILMALGAEAVMLSASGILLICLIVYLLCAKSITAAS